MRLTDRVAVVTGGGSGLGRAIALRFAAEGAAVLTADLDAEAAASVAEAIRGEGGRAQSCRVDVTSQEQVEAMVAEAVGAFGAVHILVNSAGIGEQTPFLKQRPEEFERILAVNLTGSYRCARALAPEMTARRYGRIVNIASVAGLRGVSGRVGYGASKSGVVGLTQQLAVELAPFGITVNAIAPGPVDTAMTQKVHSAATRETYCRNIPLHRYGTPEEIAAGAAFLASDDAAYITGHTLPIDGGFTSTAAIFETE